MQLRKTLRSRKSVLAAAAALFLLTAPSASASTSNIPGCAPQCLQPRLTSPGNLPAGKYKTKYFFAGQMTLSVPKGWLSGEDSTGEFWASPRTNENVRVIFWEDVYAAKSSEPGYWQRVGPLRQTSQNLLARLQKNPNLTVSKPTSGKIGTIRARVLDIGVSDRAVNDDPGCPAKACANFLHFPQWGEPYGIAGKAVTRFYLSDVRYGGQRHLFVAAIEATSPRQLSAFAPTANKLIATVRVPATQG